ncbi:calcium-binding protein [Saccharothrix stipae]
MRTMVNAAVVAVLCVAPAPVVTAEEGDPAVGSLQVVGSVLEFRASDGVANDVETWRSNATHMDVVDIGPLDAQGPGCVPSPDEYFPDKVTCDLSGVTSVRLDLGDLDDRLLVRDPMSALVTGGGGDDVLWAGSGDDTLKGGPGADFLDGGPGNDLLLGGTGADRMAGGPGVDTVSYADHLVTVNADADGQAEDDGQTGEGDTIATDVENIAGGSAADFLGGNSAANDLVGGGGDDLLLGYAGVDRLHGGSGFDLLDGGTGPSGAVESDLCDPGPQGARLVGCERTR